MLKLSVVFGVLFLASTSHGLTTVSSSLLSSISDTQSQVESTVESAIASIQAAAEEGLVVLNALTTNLSGNATTIVNTLQTNLESTIANAESEVDALVSQVTTVSTTSCSSLVDTLSTIATSIVSEAVTCVTDKVETAYGYITSFKTEIETLISELRDISIATSNCTSDVSTLSEATNAVICVNKQLATATILSASSLIAVTSDVAKFSTLISNLQVDLPVCVILDSLSVFTKQAITVVEDVQTCIVNLTS